MVYRFLLISLLADVGVMLFCATLVAEHVIALGLLRYGSYMRSTPWWWSQPGLHAYLALALALSAFGVYLVWPGLQSWVATGAISFEQMHWSRVIVAAFAVMTLLQLLVARALLALLVSIDARQGYLFDCGPDGAAEARRALQLARPET
jgi:hypothetical protein